MYISSPMAYCIRVTSIHMFFFFVTIDTFWFLNDVKKVQVISIWNILCFTDPVSYFSFFFPSFPYIYT